MRAGEIMSDSVRKKFDDWYKSPHGEAQFELGMHYLGWAYICYAEGYKQAALESGVINENIRLKAELTEANAKLARYESGIAKFVENSR